MELVDVFTRRNPESVKLNTEGVTGCKTVFDVAPTYLAPWSGEELRAHLL